MNVFTSKDFVEFGHFLGGIIDPEQLQNIVTFHCEASDWMYNEKGSKEGSG